MYKTDKEGRKGASVYADRYIFLSLTYYYDEEEVRYTLDCMSCYDVLSMFFFSDEINRRLFLGEETVICAQKRAENDRAHIQSKRK